MLTTLALPVYWDEMLTGPALSSGSGETPNYSPLGWMLLALSLAGLPAAAYFYVISRSMYEPRQWESPVLFGLLAASGIAAIFEFSASTPLHFRVALAFRSLSLLFAAPFLIASKEAQDILLSTFVVNTAAREPYPRNILYCSAFVAFLMGICFWSLLGAGMPLPGALAAQLDFFFIGFCLVLPSCLFTKYRENLIGIIKDKKELDRLLVEMAKANSQYQDYAKEAAETGMEAERLRITRDIHDIVGYALTNNIAMMEAAIDMTRRNPLGIPALLKAARDNAGEGLQQIRHALYKLREQHDERPRGLRAITRLCKLYERATHIKVSFSYGNARWEYGEAIDSAIYHLIQEGLLNAFRHGKAANVSVSLWDTDGSVTTKISDDGAGADSFEEGIGLRGMRERIEALSGQIDISTRPGSFTVLARIPIQEKSNA